MTALVLLVLTVESGRGALSSVKNSWFSQIYEVEALSNVQVLDGGGD